MGKVKKSVKKFAAKGPEAAKKAVRTHKLESAKRQKAKAAQEHKALAGTGKKKKSRGDDSDDEEEGVSAPSLEGMDVDAFMEGMGASSDEDNEDEVSGSEAEDNDEEEDEESDEDEEDNDTSRKDDDDAESDEEVADMKGALNKHKVCPSLVFAQLCVWSASEATEILSMYDLFVYLGFIIHSMGHFWFYFILFDAWFLRLN